MSFISIITVNYNDANGLEETIKSVMVQTYRDYEHIVVDGDSSDGSKEVIEKYRDTLAWAVSEPDKGIYNAMNKGIAKANGVYILFLNSGDTLAQKNIIERIHHRLKGGKDIYYGKLKLADEKNETVLDFPEKLSFGYFYDKGYLPHPASFIKRSLFDTIFRYDEKLKIAADWEFMVCAVCKYNVSYEYIDLIITNYDVDGISAKPEYRKVLLSEKQLILQRHFPLFLDDAEKYQNQNSLLAMNRFSMLQRIETNSVARKLASLCLRIIHLLFVSKNERESDKL
ncbi:MAG: glycosyltransferase [Flavobacterium sp.]|nr:MAG: glycosyltransferase [Flavobacterium sp.]